MDEYIKLLKKLYALVPSGINMGLERIAEAASLLKIDVESLKVIQIAGTNGKGSVAHMVAASLELSGLKTGLYTSPHLNRYTERLKINSKEVSKAAVASALKKVFFMMDANSNLRLTFFEVTTLIAFIIFDEAQVDIAVLEVGLGGRLDATSISNPIICAITSVGLDHVEFLGSSYERIAFEKASISRKGVPVFFGPMNDEALKSAVSTALKAGAIIDITDEQVPIPPALVSCVPWPGRHQLLNAVLAKKIFSKALSLLKRPVSEGIFEKSLKKIVLPGRFEIIDSKWLLDGAHNLEAIKELKNSIQENPIKVDAIIFGTVKEKPTLKMLEVLKTLTADVFLVKPPVERAFEAEFFAEKSGLKACSSVLKALDEAEKKRKDGIIICTGSFFLVAKVREVLLKEPSDLPVAL